MSKLFISILSFTILVPTVLVLLRFKQAKQTYLPFFYLILLSFVAELVNNLLFFIKVGNAAAVNIFVLGEFLLWLKLFINFREGRSEKYNNICKIAGIAGVILWLADNFYIGNIRQFNIWYKLYYSFVLVMLSLDQINVLIVYEKRSLKKNPIFIICIALIIFFCYKIFLEIVWGFASKFSNRLLVNIFTIQSFVNAFVNLLYALTILWIPTKKYFIKHSL